MLFWIRAWAGAESLQRCGMLRWIGERAAHFIEHTAKLCSRLAKAGRGAQRYVASVIFGE
jgi:hypothetical protein